MARGCPSERSDRRAYALEEEECPDVPVQVEDDDHDVSDETPCWAMIEENEYDLWNRVLDEDCEMMAATVNPARTPIDVRGKWTRVSATLDSGAADHVCPRKMFPSLKAKDTSSNRHFVTANGARVKDEGEKNIQFTAAGGAHRNIKFRMANVVKPLISIGKIVSNGCSVHLSGSDPHILCSRSGHKIPVSKSGGVFQLDMWIDTSATGPVFGRPGMGRP